MRDVSNVREMQSYVRKVAAGRESLWRHRPPLLNHLDVELTERCNNRCVHCYISRPADDRAAAAGELDTATWRRILEEAAGLGCLTLRFTGGEPLLRDDFEELYLFARRLGLRVILATNATRMTARLASLLARIPPRERIEVSIYGLTRRTYEAVSRVPGSFAASQRGLRLLQKHRVPLTIKGALLPANRADFGRFHDWAVEVSGDPDAGASITSLYLRGRRDGPLRNARLRRLRLAPQSLVRFEAAERAPFLPETRDFLLRRAAVAGARIFACGAGDGSAAVDSHGTLQMCLLLRHPETVYDLRQGTVRDALKNVFPKLRERRSADAEYLRRCGRCFLQALCDQCPAMAWMEHGTLDTPVEHLCESAHALARALGVVGAREKAWEVINWKDRLRGAPARRRAQHTSAGPSHITGRRSVGKKKERVR